MNEVVWLFCLCLPCAILFFLSPRRTGFNPKWLIVCDISSGRSGTSGGFSLKCLRFPLLIIIPTFLHSHLSPPSALSSSPDQTAHYHIFGPPSLGLHLWPHTWLVIEAWSLSFILRKVPLLSLFLQFISHLIQHSRKHIFPKVRLLTVLCLLNTPYSAQQLTHYFKKIVSHYAGLYSWGNARIAVLFWMLWTVIKLA